MADLTIVIKLLNKMSYFARTDFVFGNRKSSLFFNFKIKHVKKLMLSSYHVDDKSWIIEYDITTLLSANYLLSAE